MFFIVLNKIFVIIEIKFYIFAKTLHLECVRAEPWNKSSCRAAFCTEQCLMEAEMISPCDIDSKSTPHLLSLMLLIHNKIKKHLDTRFKW